MNEFIVKEIANSLNITDKQVEVVLSLLSEEILFLLLQDIEKKQLVHWMRRPSVLLMKCIYIR